MTQPDEIARPRWYGYPPKPWPPGSSPELLSYPPPVVARQHVAEADRPYLAILSTSTYRWWRPAVGMLLFTVVAVAATIVVLVIPLLVLGARGDLTGPEALASPEVLLLTNLSLAILIPSALFAAWAAHRVRPGLVSSVVGRIRWGWLAAYSGIALVVVVVSYSLSGLIAGPDVVSGEPEPSFVGWATYLPLAAVIVLTTPLQAAGEEYAFRGYLAQAIGAWAKTWTWVPILVTSLLFALAHGQQDPALFADRFIFGLALALLAVRTGGLEASIALHAMNNLVILLVGALFTDLADTLTPTNASWDIVGLDAVQLVLYGGIVLALSKGRMQRTTRPSLESTASAAPGTTVSATTLTSP